MQRGFWHDYRACFRGPYGWTSWLVTIYIVVLLPVLVWLVTRALEVETTREQILYSAGVILAVMWIAFLKLWFWMRINNLELQRRIEEIVKNAPTS